MVVPTLTNGLYPIQGLQTTLLAGSQYSLRTPTAQPPFNRVPGEAVQTLIDRLKLIQGNISIAELRRGELTTLRDNLSQSIDLFRRVRDTELSPRLQSLVSAATPGFYGFQRIDIQELLSSASLPNSVFLSGNAQTAISDVLGLIDVSQVSGGGGGVIRDEIFHNFFAGAVVPPPVAGVDPSTNPALAGNLVLDLDASTAAGVGPL